MAWSGEEKLRPTTCCSSGVVWEKRVKQQRFKALKTTAAIEDAYQKWLLDGQAGLDPAPVIAVGDLQVNFRKNQVIEGRKNSQVQRVLQHGLWASYSTSRHRAMLHVKMHHFQMDNQLVACAFRTVLAPVPQPKSMKSEQSSVAKPFVELSLTKTLHGQLEHFRYCHVLVQEFSVQADVGFVNALIALATNEEEQPLYGVGGEISDKPTTPNCSPNGSTRT